MTAEGAVDRVRLLCSRFSQTLWGVYCLPTIDRATPTGLLKVITFFYFVSVMIEQWKLFRFLFPFLFSVLDRCHSRKQNRNVLFSYRSGLLHLRNVFTFGDSTNTERESKFAVGWLLQERVRD